MSEKTDTRRAAEYALRQWVAMALLIAVCATPAWALAPEDILMYAPMDGTPMAAIAKGEAEPRVRGKLEFTEGRRGQGYWSGGPGCELAYMSEGNIDVEAGTVAMWVKPVGWSHSTRSKEPNMRWWFRAGEGVDAQGVGKGNFLWLYKLKAHVPVYWLVQHDYRQRSFYYTGHQHEWVAGKWSHIAGTWCGPVMRLYVNGRMTGMTRTPTPRVLRNFGRRFIIGAESWSKRPDCVIDDVYILRRPVTETECRTLMTLGPDAFSKGAFPTKMQVEAAYFPSKEELAVRLKVNGRRPGEMKGLTASFTIQDMRTARPTDIDAVTRPVTEVNGEESIDTKQLAPGPYEVIASLSDGGKVTSLMSAAFEKPGKPEWLGNEIGIPKKVPKPWTPLVREGQTVDCWGRRIVYGASLFPAQITSQGRELLARPITLTATQNGKPVTPTNVVFKWTRADDLRAEFEITARLGAVPVSATGWIEFDGFVWTELSIPATPGQKLESLRLEVAMRPQIATLQHGGLKMNFQPPDGKVHAWKVPFLWQPFLWLGNEEVGLQWSTGDNYSWENAVTDETMSLAPSDREVLFTATLVDHEIPLDRPLRYTFGLHATPVKPLARDWRRYDAGFNCAEVTFDKPSHGKWAIFYQKWNAQTEATPKGVFGYQAVGPKSKELIAGTNASGMKPLIYWNVNAVWRGAPAYRAFRSEWEPNNPPALPFETCDGRTAGRAWRTVRSFQDWAIWRYAKTLRENPWLVEGISGFYNDVVQGFWGVEPRSDREGLIRTRHELLGMRELQKRFYVLVENDYPGKVLVNHQSSDTHMSQLAFAHAYVTGETFRGRKGLGKELGYYHVMDLAACRATLLAAQWGLPVVFLPEVWGNNTRLFRKAVSSPEGLRGAEHLAGLLLVHDATPWSAYVHPLPFCRLAAMKQQFSWDEKTEFVGYWKSSGLVALTTKTSPVVVSVFKRPGKVMFVVMNNSDEDAEVALRPDWPKLGLAAPARLMDAYTAPGIPDGELDVREYSKGRLIFHLPKTTRETLYVPAASSGCRLTVRARNFRALVTE